MNELLEQPRQIRKFNPGTFQSDVEVISQFVVRNRELGVVLDVLRGNAGSPSCQHVLLVGPRGRGKTMLLARIAAELRTDGDLSDQLLPIRFTEESHEIFNLGDFWLESLFYLARERGVRDPDLARELRDVHAALAAERHGRELEERARAAVLEIADRLGKRLVLMVENLQALCRDVDDDFGWKLRGVLQSEPQIILLATATSRFRELEDAEHAFFELFRIVRLEPLDTGECRRLWQMVTGDDVRRREIRPLQILTGGDPRLLVIIGGFAQHRSLGQLMEDLVRLIDDHTEYFRAHLEGFAKTERRVYLALIDLWQPSTTGEIAARARLDVRIVSTLLGRLVERGAVVVEGNGKKRVYVAAQRLYSIYYKLRRERDEAAVVRNLIRFMAVFYTDDELTEMAGQLRREAVQSPIFREGIEQAIAETPQISRIFAHEEWQAISSPSERAMAVGDKGAKLNFRETMAEVDETGDGQVTEFSDRGLGSRRESSPRAPEPVTAPVLWRRVLAHGKRGEHEAEIATYDQIVALIGDSGVPELQVLVAEALVNKGVTQGQLGDAQAEMAAYDAVAVRFGDSDVPELQVQVAAALVNKGATQEELGDVQAAMAAYDAVAARFGDSDVPELQVTVAKALVSKGIAQGELGDAQAAMAAYDAVAARFGDSDVPELQVQVAKASFNKGIAQRQLGDAQAAMAAFDAVAARFGDSDIPELQVMVAAALVYKGATQEELGDARAAMAAFDAVAARFGDSDIPELQVQVAAALVYKGIAQGELGDAQAAMAAYDAVAARFGDSDVPELQVPVAAALVNKGVTQGELGDAQAAMATHDAVAARFGDSDVPELQVMVAKALANKGIAQGQLGDAQAAMAAFDAVAAQFGDSELPELQLIVARSLVNKAEAEIRLGRAQEALHTCEQVERRGDVLAGIEKGGLERRARWVRTRALLLLEQHTEAMDVFRSVYAVFVPGEDTMVSEMLEQVPNLIAAGASERDLVGVLSSESEKTDALMPLVVALRQRAGEVVRAPVEVLEIAADIRREMETKLGSGDDASPGASSA